MLILHLKKYLYLLISLLFITLHREPRVRYYIGISMQIYRKPRLFVCYILRSPTLVPAHQMSIYDYTWDRDMDKERFIELSVFTL